MIEVRSLVKMYGELRAVADVSFDVERGEIFAFCGPNGAGKTTTVEILECLRTPTAGEVRVLGLDISRSSHRGEIRRRVGVLPQEFNTFELLTVKENLKFYAGLFDDHLDVDELIGLIEMEEYSDIFYKNLSGGLKQRVGVALALVNDPEVVFLDEPTTGLDPKARRSVWDIIRGLKQRGRTVFLTTHYMDEVEALADNVAVILKGRIIAEGAPRRLIAKYGGHQTLIIEGGGEDAYRALKNRFTQAEIEPNGDVKARFEDSKDLTEAFGALNGVAFERLSVAGGTFDDVFLNLTGRKIVEGELQ